MKKKTPKLSNHKERTHTQKIHPHIKKPKKNHKTHQKTHPLKKKTNKTPQKPTTKTPQWLHPELHLKSYQKDLKLHLAHCFPRNSYTMQCQQEQSGLSFDLHIPRRPLHCPSSRRPCSSMNSEDTSGRRKFHCIMSSSLRLCNLSKMFSCYCQLTLIFPDVGNNGV